MSSQDLGSSSSSETEKSSEFDIYQSVTSNSEQVAPRDEFVSEMPSEQSSSNQKNLILSPEALEQLERVEKQENPRLAKRKDFQLKSFKKR